ncbi:hypothetical protein IW261DRAFT_1459809 [Armillaria novae-zelandiae]|uniref:Transmembrane protein n=1 Tax=Armillaria novae-zelandiae TaxID=153914 RepID=A0AA39PJ12_9AGAR|nr:hypothetical protein IW261DRAFT_1459809 [Armillaria novae-zelandiae]
MIVSFLYLAVFWLSLLVGFATTRPVRYQVGFQGPIKANAALKSHRSGVCNPGMSQGLGYACENLPKSQALVVFASEPSHALMPSMVLPASETPSYVEGPLRLYDSSRVHSRDLPNPQNPPVVASERSDRLMQNAAFCASEMPRCEDITSAVDEPSQVHAEHSIKSRLLASERNQGTSQQPRLSTPVFIFPRTAIQNPSNDVITSVPTARQVPMFASFTPLLSYSSVVLFIAFVASRLQRWFSRRRRRQGSLGLDGVELLPTTTASVLPEFRDYVVQPPNVPSTTSSPVRLGRRIETHVSVDALGAVGTQLKKSGRSQSLSLPKADSSGLHAPIQLRPFNSEPRSKSTPNTPNGLLVDLSSMHDWNARDGIHTRKPFVNDVLHGSTNLWATDANVSSDTLFGLRQTLSNRSVDIADVPLKSMVMKPRVLEPPTELISVAVLEPSVGTKATSPSLSDSSEQDITLVHNDSDYPLIDFSPKGGSALDLTATVQVADDALEIEVRGEGTNLLEEKPLMEFSQWDEEGWGFEVVSLPSADDEFVGIARQSALTREEETAHEVADHNKKPLLPSPVQNSTDVHDEYSVQDITVISSPLHADEKVILADEDAKPDGVAAETAAALVLQSVEDALISSAAENLRAAAVLDEEALVMQSLVAESSETAEAVELQDISDNSDPFSDFDDVLNSNQTTPPVLIEPPATIDTNEQEHDNHDIYDNSDDNEDPFHHPYEVLAEPQGSESPATDTIDPALPLEAECPPHEMQLVPDILPSESFEVDPSIDTAIIFQPEMNAPALSPIVVLDSSPTSPVDPVSAVQRGPELLNLEDITTDLPILEPVPLQLVIDQHARLTATEEFPDPDLIPLPISPKEQDSSLLVHQTTTSPTLPAVSPLVRRAVARPAWSLRASDAPPLGLSTSASAADLPSPTDKPSAVEKKVKNEVETADDFSPVSPLPSASSMTLSSSLPGAFPESESKETVMSVSTSKEVEVRSTPSRPRVTRSPLDIALAMQLRPGLGVGADPAWMVRFLMSMFGWFVVTLSGSGGSDGYHYPTRR